MSKISIEKHGKLLRPSELRESLLNSTSKLKDLGSINPQEPIQFRPDGNTEIKHKEATSKKSTFASFIPKMSLNLEKVVEQNPRILDLREKLNEITRKQKTVDKKTKGLINDMTQQLVDEKEVESGPYSLLFDLQEDSAASSKETADMECRQMEKNDVQRTINKSTNSLKNNDRLPNVLNFDEKPMREFEYSCENDFTYPVKKTFNTHSRSDLCLQLKSQVHARLLDTNQSPVENSLRTNEENSLDDSLGILTPDQMDDMCYMDNTFSPTVEGLPTFCESNECNPSPDNGDTPSTDKTESNSAASTIQNDGFDIVSNKKHEPNISHDHEEQLQAKDIMEHSPLTSPCIISANESVCFEIGNTSICGEIDTGTTENISTKLEFVIEEDFMPSIHSSILEPASSIAEITVNLDIPLDCKHVNPIVSRVEQTPSPEELPLDASDINGEISTYSQFSASTLHESQTYSDNKTDYTKSMETSKVSNSFITSITSITSLDGYQGDGEMSRPVSRGADHSVDNREDIIEMDWQNVPVTRRADPMTDSDFFTESDADGLDDGMQRGDRKAQVIDGALYGGKNGNGNPALIVNRNDDSCMESSGVYTDLDRSSPVFLNVIDDMSPEGSTPSTRSDCSQKKGSNGKLESIFTPETKDLKIEQSTNLEVVVQKSSSKRNSLNNEKDSTRCNEKIKEEKRFTLKKYKMPKRDVPSKLKSMLANRSIDTDTSAHNSPKTVKKVDRFSSLSKKNSLDLKSDYKTKSFKDIKSKVDCSFSLQRSQTACSVNRLSSKSTNTNTKPKSRHMRMRMDVGSAAGSGKSSLHSSQSDISAISTPLGKHTTGRFPLLRNGKKRESTPAPSIPVRPASPNTVPAKAKKNGVVQKLSSSPVTVRARTSLAPPPSPRKPPPPRVPVQRPNTLPTNKETPRVTAAVGPRGKRIQTPQQTRTPPAPLSAPLPLPAPVPKEQSAALAHAAKGVEALGVLVQYLVFRLDALNGSTWRAEADRWRGVAAAERTSAARADRDRQQRAQKDLDTIAECLSKISELEMEVSSKEEANARLQASHIEEVTALANDIKELKDTIESLKHEVAESRARLHAHSEIERTLRAQLEAARAEVELVRRTKPSLVSADASTNVSGDLPKPCNMCDAACDPVHCEVEECELRLSSNQELSTDANELAAEVRSLRAVVELKQVEIASLRDARSELAVERERRVVAEREARSARHAAEELRERAAARQRDADRLKDDNRRLRDMAARDRDHATRMTAVNEELRYKLRQKSQVVSLLAGSGYVERARCRTTSASGESARSTSPVAAPGADSPESPCSSPAPAPAPTTPPPNGHPAPLPAVKGVVEKHDSVSWVLEIEETPEEVASRLARKSSFRTAAVSPSGVKRRGGGGGCGGGGGGGSPGSASPAPASPAPNASKLFRPGELDFPPPPLKESAGEAIYIYDDRQY